MKSIDFLIPAYNCEQYLEKCIRSILNMKSENYNILIYNDGSTDSTLDVANKLRKLSDRITLINSCENKGIINARKELISHASSTYIFFVDADDYLLGTKKIFEYAEKSEFDIIQFNRQKINHFGKILPLDRQIENFQVHIDDALDYFGRWGKNNNINYSIHNKLIRRSCLPQDAIDTSVFPDIFEDILLNLIALSYAQNILLENSLTYIYRTQIASITSDPAKIVAAADKLITFIELHFNDERYSTALCKIQRNIFEIYIPNKIKDESSSRKMVQNCYDDFLKILAAHQFFFQKTIYDAILSRVLSHACLLFEIKDIASRVRNSGLDTDDVIYNTIRITASPKKNKGKAIYQVLKERATGDIKFIKKSIRKKIEAYQYYLLSLGYSLSQPYVAVIDYPGREEAKRIVQNNLCMRCRYFDSWDVSPKTKAAIANAQLIVTSVPYAPLSKLKLKGKVFNIWHASGAFKKFGWHDSAAASVYGKTDYMICSSDDIKVIYADSMKLPLESVFATGTPRTDIYFDEDRKSLLKESFFAEFPEFRNKKIYVYMPTYREFAKRRFFRLGFSMEELAALLADDEIFIIKNHPSITARILKNKSPHAYTNVKSFGKVYSLDSADTDTLTIASSVFITDYSSAFFEAMLLDKPLVFYAEDFSSYARDFYFDYEELPGFKVLESSAYKLVHAARDAVNCDPHPNYKRFKDKNIGNCDGHSTKRVVDIINSIIEKRLTHE